jgi:lysophospholipase L1-like esterase
MVASPVVRSSQLTTLKTHPKKVVVIGDSLVYGFGDTEAGGWVERLRRRSLDPEQQGPILYNLGVRGDCVQQVSHRLETEFRMRGELRRRLPDLMILSVGLNDAARLGRATGRPMTDESTFKVQIEALLTQARELCPVLFVGMVPVNEAAMPYADTLYFSRADQLHYKNITQAACQAHQIPYLDIYEQWLTHGEAWCQERLCRDGLHPNVLGYRSLSESIQAWQALNTALND